MDVYLRVEKVGDSSLRHSGRQHLGDVHLGDVHLGDVNVRVDPNHLVSELAAALGDFFGCSGRETLGRSATGPFDDDHAVGSLGLVSGETLVLGIREAVAVDAWSGASLVVASGPDVGATCHLRAGEVVVGRDNRCDLFVADPRVSRRHLRFVTDPDGGVTVEALTSTNPARVDGAPLRGAQRLGPNSVIQIGGSSVVVRTPVRPRAPDTDGAGNVAFQRTPYFPSAVPSTTVAAISDIPTTPEPRRFGYLSAVLPLLVGVGFALLFGPRYLLFALFSPVMLIGSHIEHKRRTSRRFTTSIARFDDALAAKQSEVAAAVAVERTRRFDAAPDLAQLGDRVSARAPDLWIRGPDAPDVLSLRFGIADVPAALSVDTGRGGDEEFQERVANALGTVDVITDVPVSLSISELGVVSLVGRLDDTAALLTSLVLQACCLHSPEDLVVLMALSPSGGVSGWPKWLPHTRSASSPIDGRHLASTTAGTNELVGALLDEARRRITADAAADRRSFPRLLVVLDGALGADPALTSKLLDVGPAVGISVLWLADSHQRVPRQAATVVTCRSLTSTASSSVSFTDPTRDDQPLDLERSGQDFAERMARDLAPLRDASFAGAATSVPRVVPLFAGLGVASLNDDWVMEQWQRDHGYSLAAPVGHTASGPLVLDLVAHGPHGLIGGTSGAGKSELVMSMVAGLIAHHPPSAVNFLFIDYKGGASSSLFAAAPHTVGYVTNLDGLLAKRALISLRAELNRRMALLEGKAKDLAELTERFPEDAPPSLLIVVDEFATLVTEVPEFVAGMVDVAQRGRSLGIHLLLATQRPSGAFNDNITANANLRLSLRMLDGAESSSLIGSPVAAAIPVPLKGRGYVKIGSAEPQAFQSSWAGAPLLAPEGAPSVSVSSFDPSGCDGHDEFELCAEPSMRARGRTSAGTTATRTPTSTPTQIDALLDAVAGATERLGLQPGRPPWLDVLPPILDLDQVRSVVADAIPNADGAPEPRPGAAVVFGMVDDPAAQAQYPAVVNLAQSGGLIISGTGGAGKSTLLETIAVSAALDDVAAGGGELSVFAIDFASRSLVTLRKLPQCGGVATGDDIEAVTRTIDVLYAEFERRRRVSAEAMANDEETSPPSSVLLLIDGVDAVFHALEQAGAGGLGVYLERLTTLITDGRQVAMFPVVATARRAALRSTVTAAISARVTLRQADAQGYVDCGIATADAAQIELGPGQGFFNGPQVVQVASVTAWPDHLTDHGACRVAPELESRSLPTSLPLLASHDPLRPTVGLTDITAEPFRLDLRHDDVVIVGDPRSGRSTALVTIGRQAASAGTELWVLGRPGSPLATMSEVAVACFDEGEMLADVVESLVERATDRTVAPAARLLLVDDYDLFPEHCQRVTTALSALLRSVRYVAAGPTPRAFSAHQLVQVARSARSMVYLRPHDARDAHEVTGVPVRWRPGVPMVEGRGYVVVDRTPTLVQFSDPGCASLR